MPLGPTSTRATSSSTCVYLLIFTFLIYFLVYNVKRLVDLRIREGEAAVKAKERAAMAASVAHEIKNPLEGIYGAAQLLKEEAKGNGRFIDMILKDSVRLNGVVQQFLQFSRPFLHPHGPLRRRRGGAGLLPGAGLAGRRRHGPLRRRTGCGEGYLAHADPEGLRQVLLNLYQNARRYQKPGQPVDVKVRGRDGTPWKSPWRTTGRASPRPTGSASSTPFSQLPQKAPGLGLAISRKIAREMGGDLYFEPKEPGARFVVVLKPGRAGAASA